MKYITRGVCESLFGLLAGIAMLGVIGCQDDSDKNGEIGKNPVGAIEPIAELMVQDAQARESGDVAIFKVYLDRPAPSDLAIFYYTDNDSTATPGIDFIELPGKVTIPAGSSSAEIIITPLDDSDVDGIETVIISLSGGPGYKLVEAQALYIEISSDDAPRMVTITTQTPIISENGETGSFTINADDETDQDLIVKYQVSRQSTATTGLDYQPLSGTATIPAGNKAVNVPITPNDDDFVESDEKVIVVLLPSGSFYEADFPNSAEITIVSDELPIVNIETVIGTGSENGTDGIFQFSIPVAVEEDLVIEYQILGSAGNGIDYQLIPQSAVIPKGETVIEVVITPIADSVGDEGEEFVTLSLLPGDAYGIGGSPEATVTINDYVVPVESESLPLVAFDVPDNVAGRDGDTATIRFFVEAVLSHDLTIGISPQTGANLFATPGVDYIPLPDQVTIPAGEMSTTITITPIESAPAAENRLVLMEIQPGSDYQVEDNSFDSADLFTKLVTIISRPELPQARLVSRDDTATEQGDPASFTVELDRPASVATTIYYQIDEDWPRDAALVPGSITIPAGRTSATQEVVAIQDNLSEGPEYLSLTLIPTEEYGVIFANFFLALKILDDGGFPMASVEAVDPIAREHGLDTATFVVRLDRPASEDLYIDLEGATYGSATLGQDYLTYPAKTLIIPQGAVAAEVMIVPIDDEDPEEVERITFSLSGGQGYNIDDWGLGRSAEVELHSDEDMEGGAPVITVSVVNQIVSEAGGEAAIFRLSLSEPLERDINIEYYNYGSAEEGVDYVELDRSYTIPAGEMYVDVHITPIDDNLLESAEYVHLSFRSSQLSVVSEDGYSEIQIISDEDGPHASIFAANIVAHEGGEPAVFEVRLDRPAPTDVTVTFEIDDDLNYAYVESFRNDYEIPGTTLVPGEYQRMQGSVTILAGEESAEVRIIATDDTYIEGPEMLDISLNDGEGYIDSSFSDVEIYLVSDDPGPLTSIAGVVHTAVEGEHDAVFEIVLNEPATENLEILYDIDSWSFRADIEELSGIAIVPKGSTSVQVRVRATELASSSMNTHRIYLQPGPGYGVTRNDRIEIQVLGLD